MCPNGFSRRAMTRCFPMLPPPFLTESLARGQTWDQQVLTPKSNQRKPHQLPKHILICCQESRESFVFGQLCKKTSAFYLGSFTSKISWKNSSLSSSMTALLDRLPRCKVSHKQSEWTWTLDIVCSLVLQTVECKSFTFLSDPSPIFGYACQWLTHHCIKAN